MNNIKKVLSLGLAVSAFVFVFSFYANAQAATCTAEAAGVWDNTVTWDAACNGNTIPDADDDVIIPGNFTVTVNGPGALAGTVSISNPIATGNNGISFAPTGTLVVAGAVTIVGSSGASHSTIDVSSGSLSAASLAIAGGASTGNSVVTVSSGTITTTGAITFSGTAARAQLTSTGASSINVGGHLTSGGTFTRGSSTVTFNGSGAQNVGAYSYHNVTINKSAGTATLIGNALILNELRVSSGTFDSSTHALDITFLTDISSGATLIHGTGHKVQNGVLVIDAGGAWIETGAATVDFLGHVTNNGTFTSNTGLHRFLNFTRDINGTFSIPSVSFIGDAEYTNYGTFTISTSLGGDGELINGEGATLNIGDDIVDNAAEGLTLTASATGNTVNYNRAGDQTVKAIDYYNLTLEGTGIKTIPDINVQNDTVFGTGLSAAVLTNGSTTTTGGLKLGGSWKSAGTWGSTGSAATNQNNTYFAVANSGIITSTLSHASSTIITSDDNTNDSDNDDNEDTTTTTSDDDTEATEESAADEGCVGNNAFSSTTGRPCTTNTSATITTYAFGTGLVKLGTKGEACKAWQTFFNNKANAGLVVDGWCGAKTIAAAKTWQAAAGLVADGLLGPKSIAKALSM